MKRRKFVTTAAAAPLVAPYTAGGSFGQDAASENEIYELRTYELSWGGNRGALTAYLNDVEKPYVQNHGANHFMTFVESGQALPSQLWTLTSFPDFASYQNAFSNRSNERFVQQSKGYSESGQTFNRISSSLLYAFDGLKQMKTPIENAALFELRIYEGVNEDAVRRKTKMFNDEELELFYKVDLNPVFFGSMMVGSYVPSLVYMLNYRDMEHRDQAWKDFLEHPDWLVMRDKEIYANTVSNIRRVFLEQG
ncbi:MAG: hypothetical protein DHS20C17_03710 [Cyclobacteriaceae bacterium]|nr:MAG: hypothetical protein DHS20C17_03710 [Cyclobacteriaceae bacterium]